MTWSRIILFSKDEESRFRTCSMWHAPIAKLFSLNILQKPSVNKTIDVKTISKSLKQCVTVSWVILNDSFSFWVFLVRTFGDYITHLLSRPCTDQEETFDQNFERRYRWYEIRVNIWLICQVVKSFDWYLWLFTMFIWQWDESWFHVWNTLVQFSIGGYEIREKGKIRKILLTPSGIWTSNV